MTRIPPKVDGQPILAELSPMDRSLSARLHGQTLEFSQWQMYRRQYKMQRLLDLLIVIPMSIIALPVVFLAGMAVRCTSQGSALYSQIRLGRGGRPFRIYKLRSMFINCEAKSGVRWATSNDSRVTPIGRILRKLHIDELPQLWNVLRGDMSFVGPRPERPEIISDLIKHIPDYPARLLVNPGVTGLAQIQHPPDSDIEGVRQKLAFDRAYISSRGLWLDIRIMFGTLIYLVGFSYEQVRKIGMLPTVEMNTSQPIPQYRPVHAASCLNASVTLAVAEG